MKIDRKTLAERAWAIPAICGLMVLHHDFKTPRLARVQRLVWLESSVDVYLQYGICNLSGNVIDSIHVVVSLHRGGAVGILAASDADKSHQVLLAFLAGEAYREARRWGEDMQAWEHGETVDGERAVILAIVSALVAHKSCDMHVEIVKDAQRGGSLRKARLVGEAGSIDITPAGFHGVNLYVKGTGTDVQAPRLYQEADLRQPSAQAKTPAARFLKGAASGARQLIRLPMGAVHYWSRKMHRPELMPLSDFAGYHPASVVDAHGGDRLSALSN